MTECKNRFCAEESPPPVNAAETDSYGGGSSIAGSTSSQSHHPQGDRGIQYQWSRAMTSQPPPLAGFKEDPAPLAQVYNT